MTCREFWTEMPELAGGRELADHALECTSCAALLDRHRALAAGLKRMAEGRDDREAPRVVEARLIEAFRKEVGLQPVSAQSHRLAWALTAAAAIVLSILVIRGRLLERLQPQELSNPQTAAVPWPAATDDSDYIPLPYFPQDGVAGPTEDADLVRVEVPRATLVALGLPVEGGSGRVEAVVALGADGTVEGVQILQ